MALLAANKTAAALDAHAIVLEQEFTTHDLSDEDISVLLKRTSEYVSYVCMCPPTQSNCK